MTQEQKARAYDEAIGKLRDFYRDYDTISHLIDVKEELANLFPELKESEDERIRKELIEQVAYIVPKNYEVDSEGDALPTYQKRIDKYRAWLEKQKPIDEEELKKGALKYVARQFMNWLDAKIPEDEMCLSNAECKVIEDAFLKDDWARISHYMCEKLEKQGEQIELKKVEQGNHPRIVMADFNGGEGFFKLNLDNLNKEQVDAIEMMINNPKQGEQTQLDYEHADIPQKDFAPVKPKFKVGDWVVTDYGRVSHVVSVDKYGDGYTLDNGVYFNGSWCDMYHLWTIQDAKDGDVLMTTKTRNCPFIYRKTDYNNNLAYYYAGIDGNGDFWEGCIRRTLYHFGPVSNVTPATKKWRDLLFQKMKEAGYEWDGEKKELKKIEPKALNADKVIEWLENQACQGWIEDVEVEKFVDKFKKDFGL